MSTESESPDNTPQVNVATPPKGKTVWRCVHDGSELLAAFETDGTTESVHTILDFETKEAMDAAIVALRLVVDPAVYTLPQEKPIRTPGIHVR